MSAGCDVAQALAEEIRRRETELDVLRQAYAILVRSDVLIDPGSPIEEDEPTVDPLEAEGRPTPALPAFTEPGDVCVSPQRDVGEVEPVQSPEPAPPKKRGGQRRGPDPKSMAECTNGMQFLRVWAGLHGGMVNLEDAAGEMFKRDDLRSDSQNVQALAKLLVSRLSVYKDFTRVDAGLYRYEKHQPAEPEVPRPPKERCRRCDGDLRQVDRVDGSGAREVVMECWQCGREHQPDQMATEAA